MAKIAVVGSSNTDMVIRTSRFPVPGETIIGGDFYMFPGGKGANQAVAAARMGGSVNFICNVGDDVFGKSAIAGYQKEGINTDGVIVTADCPSGVALITVNAEGENEIVVASGANDKLSREQMQDAEKLLASSDIVLTQLETPIAVVEFLAEYCRAEGKRLILNPAPAREIPTAVLDGLFLITPNETESELLTGIRVSDAQSASKAASKFLELGVGQVVITMGSRGSFFKDQKEEFTITPPKVKAVDTTAAGDVFNGALTVFLSEGKSWRESLELASKAAALSVTRMGAQASAPLRNEI